MPLVASLQSRPKPNSTLVQPQSKSWTEISAQGRVPPPRHSHITCVYKDHLYLFGGQDELGAHSYAMWVSRLQGTVVMHDWPAKALVGHGDHALVHLVFPLVS